MERKRYATDRVFGTLNSSEFCPDVGSGLLEGRRAVQVVVFERVKVEDFLVDLEDVVPDCLVERERLPASQDIRRD